MTESMCAGCGGRLPAAKPKQGRPRRWCSETCRVNAWRERNPEARAAQVERRAARKRTPDVPCPYCGGPMRPHWSSCSSTSCRREETAKRQREWQAKYRDEHGERHGTSRYGDAKRADRDRRRAREFDEDAELFERHEVFERDGWVCWLCEAPVDSALAYPDPMSASLDHVIPLSRDGAHVMSNARCSHLICNVRRGNRDAS